MGWDITGIGSVADLIGKAIDKIWPDATKADEVKLELFKAEQAGAFKELDASVQIAIEQIKVNTMEAQSNSPMARTWRPAVGWVCVAALAWNFVGHPLMTWAVAFMSKPITPPPLIDTAMLYPLLFGMLGLGAMRSFEKVTPFKP